MSKNSCLYGPRCDSCVFNMVPKDGSQPEAYEAAFVVHNAFRSPGLPASDATIEEFVGFAQKELTELYTVDKTHLTGVVVASLVLDQAGICDQRQPSDEQQ